MSATLRYVLITAVRDRFIGAIVLALLAAVGVAMFLGASALAEQQALGLAYAGQLARLILLVGLVTFICFHVRRMYETREIEAILARPISRTAFVLAYFAAYAVIALALALLVAPMLMAGLAAGGPGLAEWEASLMLECTIVVALSLFCAMALESASAAVLATLGLYLLGRSAAFFRAIAESGTGVTDQAGLNQAARWVMEAIAAVMPRIDLFGQSRWLISGPGGGWGLEDLLMQTAIYVPLLLLATIRDLHVKRF
jgi:hypothetical protein